MAEHLYHQAGGPALYVSVSFDDDLLLTKKSTEPLARGIADAVLRCCVPKAPEQPVIEIPREYRPKGISHILLGGSVDGVDRLWDCDAGGWVAPISSEDVAEVIRAKALREPLARSRCDELWLVIVSDEFSRAAPAEISPEALAASYPAPFDTIIWLLPHEPRAIGLSLKPLRKPLSPEMGKAGRPKF